MFDEEDLGVDRRRKMLSSPQISLWQIIFKQLGVAVFRLVSRSLGTERTFVNTAVMIGHAMVDDLCDHC